MGLQLGLQLHLVEVRIHHSSLKGPILLSCLRAVTHAPASLNFPSLQQTSQPFSRRRCKFLKIRHNLQLSAGMGENSTQKPVVCLVRFEQAATLAPVILGTA